MSDITISAELLERMYRFMALTRASEERAIALYRQGRLKPVYSCVGNEAIAVCSALALERDDILAPTHRSLGAHLVHGHTLREVWTQQLKKATSHTQGKDSGIHLGKTARILPMISPLAAMMPTVTGVLLADRVLGKGPHVALSFVGDGATSLGDFHEALNLAGARRLPLVTVIENNLFAYGTPNKHQFGCASLADRAAGYGMAGARIDGSDPVLVYTTVKEAVDRAREGGGPTLIEAVSLRRRGHAEHDPAHYVPPALREEWEPRDPIRRINALVESWPGGVPFDRTALDAAIAEEVEDAVRFAFAQPDPQGPEAATGVFRADLGATR